jgi:hypothetical protein
VRQGCTGTFTRQADEAIEVTADWKSSRKMSRTQIVGNIGCGGLSLKSMYRKLCPMTHVLSFLLFLSALNAVQRSGESTVKGSTRHDRKSVRHFRVSARFQKHAVVLVCLSLPESTDYFTQLF